jgi:CMP-N-acetylneuraminic acid synthetase
VKKRIACIIPARSGSQRIKNKNIIKINNKYLIELIFEKIVKSKKIHDFFLATDDKKIYDKIGSLKRKVNFFHRSKSSSTSDAKTEVVLEEFLKVYKQFEIIIFVQATNPFINYKYLDNAIEKFINKKYDSLLSVVSSKSFLWKKKIPTKPINYNFKDRKMSQDLDEYFVENGSFYIFYKKNFMKYKNRLHKKIGTFEMPRESIFEIDDYVDLKIIKKLIN